MSKVIINRMYKDVVQIDREGEGEFQIQNISDSLTGSDTASPLIFKMKVNIKQRVQIKPIYGILMDTGPQSKRKISVKYIGDQSEINKIKLQVGWTKLNRNCQLLTQAGKRILYPDLYKESVEKNQQEKFFVTFESRIESCISQVKQNFAEPKQFRFQNKIRQEEKERIYKLQKKISKHQIKKDKQQPCPITLKQLLSLVFFIFLFGVSFGIKINRLGKDSPKDNFSDLHIQKHKQRNIL